MATELSKKEMRTADSLEVILNAIVKREIPTEAIEYMIEAIQQIFSKTYTSEIVFP